MIDTIMVFLLCIWMAAAIHAVFLMIEPVVVAILMGGFGVDVWEADQLYKKS